MSSPLARAARLAAALALAAPAPALAHGAVELEIERSAGGIAVRAHHHGGEPLAEATYVILSPAGSGRVHDAGRTDRHGWLAFVPDAPGRWTVRVVDASGHGKVAEVEVAAEALAPPPPAAVAGPGDAPTARSAAATPSAGSPIPPIPAADARERAGAIYRVVGGLAVIFFVFFAAFAVLIRRRGGRR